MTYYYYKIYFKNGKQESIYLKDVDKTLIGSYITDHTVIAYNNVIINWGEIEKVKCHELADTELIKIVDGTEKVMLAANE